MNEKERLEFMAKEGTYIEIMFDTIL